MSIRKNNASLVQYKEAILHEGKEWFVYYYAMDPATKELKRKKIKLNHIKGIKERRAAANRINKRKNPRQSHRL